MYGEEDVVRAYLAHKALFADWGQQSAGEHVAEGGSPKDHRGECAQGLQLLTQVGLEVALDMETLRQRADRVAPVVPMVHTRYVTLVARPHADVQLAAQQELVSGLPGGSPERAIVGGLVPQILAAHNSQAWRLVVQTMRELADEVERKYDDDE